MSQRRREDDEWVWSIGRMIALLLATALFYPPFRQNVPTAGLVFLGLLIALLMVGPLATLARNPGRASSDGNSSPLESRFWTPPPPTYRPQTTYQLLRELREGDPALVCKILRLIYRKLDYRVFDQPGMTAMVERQNSRQGLQYSEPSQGKVGVKIVRRFREALTAAQLDRGILIASEGYTRQAAKLAGTLRIELLDEPDLGRTLESLRAGHDTAILAALPNSEPTQANTAGEISSLTAAESQ